MILDIRKRIFLIAGLVLIFLLIIAFMLSRKSAQTPDVAQDVNSDVIPVTDVPTPTKDVIINAPPPPPPANAEEREKLYMSQLAKIFVERYMSYSNQDNNSHITDVTELVSERMVSFLETQKQEFSRDYKGVSTKVISSSLQSFDGSKATVKIGIQQYFEEKNKSGFTAYKNGTVSIVKGNDGWKIDGLFWEETN